MIGKRLKEIRESVGMNKKEFSEYLGLKYTTYNNYETEAREPSSDFLLLVSHRFDVSIDYLLGRKEESDILQSCSLKKNELDLIKKYRLLDEDGKRFVDETLSHESGRADQISGLEQRIADLSGEQEIEEEVEAYRRELELEKRREGEWSGSEEDAG